MADLDHMMIIDDDREEVSDQSTTRNKSHERASANHEKIKFDDHGEEEDDSPQILQRKNKKVKYFKLD